MFAIPSCGRQRREFEVSLGCSVKSGKREKEEAVLWSCIRTCVMGQQCAVHKGAVLSEVFKTPNFQWV